jgi:hypothetical protein
MLSKLAKRISISNSSGSPMRESRFYFPLKNQIEYYLLPKDGRKRMSYSFNRSAMVIEAFFTRVGVMC